MTALDSAPDNQPRDDESKLLLSSSLTKYTDVYVFRSRPVDRHCV